MNRYVVSYDITDPKRLLRVYRALRGYGDRIQYSVFRCDLSARERAELIATVDPLIQHDVDQVLIVDLGPTDGRGAECVSALGRAYQDVERRAVVI